MSTQNISLKMVTFISKAYWRLALCFCGCVTHTVHSVGIIFIIIIKFYYIPGSRLYALSPFSVLNVHKPLSYIEEEIKKWRVKNKTLVKFREMSV